ncbi:MAG: FHA domain-containing protein [Agarilytica sp.]
MSTHEDHTTIPASLASLSDGETIALEIETVIGRSPSCDLAIDNTRLSRQHAKLVFRDDLLSIEDLNSTNGTFVNDRKITETLTLKNGDVIGFEDLKYKVVLPEPANQFDEEEIESKTMVAQLPEGWWAVGEEKSEDMTRAISVNDLPKEMLNIDNKLESALENIGDKPCLICISGTYIGKVFKFNPTKPTNKWEIGKSPDCDVCLDDESISANHAQLINEGARWKLVDLMSTNGSFINGQKTLTSYLSNDDNIRLGEIQLKFKNGLAVEAKKDNTPAPKHNTAVITVGVFALTLLLLAAGYYLFS